MLQSLIEQALRLDVKTLYKQIDISFFFHIVFENGKFIVYLIKYRSQLSIYWLEKIDIFLVDNTIPAQLGIASPPVRLVSLCNKYLVLPLTVYAETQARYWNTFFLLNFLSNDQMKSHLHSLAKIQS